MGWRLMQDDVPVSGSLERMPHPRVLGTDDPSITRTLRNGAEPLRLSARDLGGHEAKRTKAQQQKNRAALQMQEVVHVPTPETQAAWLAKQVRLAYLAAYEQEMREV